MKLRISKRVKLFGKMIGGVSLCVIGLYSMLDVAEQNGWRQCQNYIRRFHPEEYDSITDRVIKEREMR